MKNILIYMVVLGILLGITTDSFARKKRKRGITPPLRVGEFIRLRATIAGVEGGFSDMVIKRIKKKNHTLALQASMLAKTNAFFDKIHKVYNLFKSQFSLRVGTPFRYQLNADEAGRKQHRNLTFYRRGRYGRLTLRVQRYTNKGKRLRAWYRHLNVPKNTRDLVSALYYARFLPYRRGKSFSFHVFVMGKIWQLRGKLIRKTKLYTAIGPRRALVIRAKVWRLRRPDKGQVIKLWLSDDSLRIPLKIRGRVPNIGVAEATLFAYRRSATSRMVSNTNRRRKNPNQVWRFISEF